MVLLVLYCMSKKWRPSLHSKLLYKTGNHFLDIQYRIEIKIVLAEIKWSIVTGYSFTFILIYKTRKRAKNRVFGSRIPCTSFPDWYHLVLSSFRPYVISQKELRVEQCFNILKKAHGRSLEIIPKILQYSQYLLIYDMRTRWHKDQGTVCPGSSAPT